jgi:[1-hydroxy-2-(trimethylamino)ethyl]phosphonate dioxygenase
MIRIREELIEIFSSRATGQYGLSEVNQLEHALQSAALAEAQGADTALIVAALLHDVGHMIHDLGDNPALHGVDDAHEAVAAAWLSAHFPDDVTEPVRLHVPAKRYLCAAEPDYFGNLAQDSVRSLALQGGPMSISELKSFEEMPHWREAVQLRRIDDLAKDPSARTKPFEHYLRYIDDVLIEGDITGERG